MMKNLQIVFTAINTAELLEHETAEPEGKEVLVRTCYSTVSCGTEKANLTGDPNCSAVPGVHFPRYSGYSSAGVVEAIGDQVTSVRPGDRVAVSWGTHSLYNVVPEENIYRLTDEAVSLQEAALFHIMTFPLAGVRKTRLELGEPAIVMGLGLLGLFSVRFAKAAGAMPLIALAPSPQKREIALRFGADFAVDPRQPDFAAQVKELTGGGAHVAIEATGVGAGLDECLDCMARFGRVSLLGCIRDSDFRIDYYRKIHFPGITLIGAHTAARPASESSPGYFTQRDDIQTAEKFCKYHRMNLKEMIFETHSPLECGDVYNRLVTDKAFPPVVQFDWTQIE